jgi:hypothetical protein
MLVPDEKYFVYHTLTQGLDARIPGLDLVKISTGSSPTTFVVGADHPFFYFEGQLKLPFGRSKSDGTTDGQTQTQTQTQTDGQTQTSTGSQTQTDAQTQDASTTSSDGSQDAPATTDAAQSDDSAPVLAVAIDSLGGIPFVPLRTVGVEPYLAPFAGQLYLRGPVPIATGVVMDGTVVVNLDPDQDHDTPFDAAYYTSPDIEIGGNGDLSVGLPFDFVDLSALGLELGQATAEAVTSEDRDRVVFSGLVTSQDFLSALPIPIRPDAGVEAWGLVSANQPLSSYVHLAGSMGVSLAGLAKLTGLPLGDISATDAVLDINSWGLVLSGRTSSQIHPDIPAGDLALTVVVPTQGDGAYVQLQGNLTLAGEELRNATIRIDAHGMTVNGTLFVGSTTFGMLGTVTAAGYHLEGSAAIGDPIAVNAESRAAAEAALTVQQATLTDLQEQLASEQASLDAANQDLADAQAAVSSAQAEVNRLQTLVGSATSSRNSAYSAYRSWVNKSCAWYDVSCQANRAAKITYYWGRYTYYAGLVGTYSAAKTVALGVLSAAQQALETAQASVSALAAQVAQVQSQLSAAQNGVMQLQTQLAGLPDVSGSVTATVTLVLENGAASGVIAATWDGVAVGGGSVRLSDPAQACVDLSGQGTLCTPL